MERKKVGVALGSGGAKGLAHIGVLRVLEEYNIPIDYISGTSMGSIVAALYSSEPNAKKLEKEALQKDWSKIFDYTFPRHGIIKGKRIENYLDEKLHNITFEDLKIPLFVTAFDIENQREVIFTKGDVSKAVRASISIPGFFIPVKNKDEILVDGAVVDPIPTEILKRTGAEIIIASNVENVKEKTPLFNEEAVEKSNKKKLPGIIEIGAKSFRIAAAGSCKADLEKDKADFVININLENMGTLDFSKKNLKKAIRKGKRETRKSLKEIKRLTEPNPFKMFLDELNANIEEKLGVKKIIKKLKQ